MIENIRKSRHHAQLASATPGRLRIKLHPSHRGHKFMDGIKAGLDSQGGVHGVKVNRSTGSVTVKYDHEKHDKASILGLLDDLDVVVQSVGSMATTEALKPGGDEAVPPEGFIAAVNDLNRRLYEKTGTPVDLKLVLPLAFAGAGIWSIARRGLMIEAVPGWLFLWFAFDMFVKLHPAQR